VSELGVWDQAVSLVQTLLFIGLAVGTLAAIAFSRDD